MPITANTVQVGQQVWVEPEGLPGTSRGSIGQVITPVNEEGHVAVAFSGDHGARVVHVEDIQPANGAPTVPPAPTRNLSPITPFQAGYTTADGKEADLACDQLFDGNVLIRFNDGTPSPRTEVELGPRAQRAISRDWRRIRDRRPRGLARSLEALGFSFVPTLFDRYGGTDEPFGGVPPELTERVLDWVADAADNLS